MIEIKKDNAIFHIDYERTQEYRVFITSFTAWALDFIFDTKNTALKKRGNFLTFFCFDAIIVLPHKTKYF